jgi:hypothetical protein
VPQTPEVMTAIVTSPTKLVELGGQEFHAMILYGTEDQFLHAGVDVAEVRHKFTNLVVAIEVAIRCFMFYNYDNLDQTVSHILSFSIFASTVITSSVQFMVETKC